MGSRSPHKNTPTWYLFELQKSDYCLNGVDYEPSEVDQMCWQRHQRSDHKFVDDMFRKQKFDELSLQRENGVKNCSKCKLEKALTLFSPDGSKPFFKRRSWCKTCRNKK